MRVYVALQKPDAVDVIDTSTNEVINTIKVGQDPRALVYVAGDVPESDRHQNLIEQVLNKRVENSTSRVEPRSRSRPRAGCRPRTPRQGQASGHPVGRHRGDEVPRPFALR